MVVVSIRVNSCPFVPISYVFSPVSILCSFKSVNAMVWRSKNRRDVDTPDVTFPKQKIDVCFRILALVYKNTSIV